MKIRVNEITVDTRVSIREREEEETIERYEDTLESLPAIVVFKMDDKYLLVDGFHRLTAAKRRGWKEIEAEVREGSYEEACEYAISANLKHGKPLTSKEYEKALRRLRELHEDWTQEKLASALNRSQTWVSSVFGAERVEKILAENNLDTQTKAEISRAPKKLWKEIGRRAEEEGWTRDETQEKVKAIREQPELREEILHPLRIQLPEAPADKLMPLSKEIGKLCDMLEPEHYDWGGGFLAKHILQGLYVLGDKVVKMIKFLESEQWR